MICNVREPREDAGKKYSHTLRCSFIINFQLKMACSESAMKTTMLDSIQLSLDLYFCIQDRKSVKEMSRLLSIQFPETDKIVLNAKTQLPSTSSIKKSSTPAPKRITRTVVIDEEGIDEIHDFGTYEYPGIPPPYAVCFLIQLMSYSTYADEITP